MRPFSATGAYSDLLYQDKDYRAESEWLSDVEPSSQSWGVCIVAEAV